MAQYSFFSSPPPCTILMVIKYFIINNRAWNNNWYHKCIILYCYQRSICLLKVEYSVFIIIIILRSNYFVRRFQVKYVFSFSKLKVFIYIVINISLNIIDKHDNCRGASTRERAQAEYVCSRRASHKFTSFRRYLEYARMLVKQLTRSD